jgi:hypothetical protein
VGYRDPQGFGLRQSSGALESSSHSVATPGFESTVARQVGKRQETAAAQDAVAPKVDLPRFAAFVRSNKESGLSMISVAGGLATLLCPRADALRQTILTHDAREAWRYCWQRAMSTNMPIAPLVIRPAMASGLLVR